ncbi:MAG: adenine nucleotide alpha hydrolase [Betaproteobacteria bacterium]|nr:adenine nucleotide alpha hydrolase [Betaproteobacteria bacterium]
MAAVLNEMGGVAVAVSGGVDSLTLATFAHRRLGKSAIMYHAVSAAVPPQATERTRTLAAQEGWDLRVVDAGEFGSEDYVRNPANRCYFCKTHLYATVTRHSKVQVVSGTNIDDLGDYRPGLTAAKEHAVRHPFVEAGLSKQDVRALARELGLPEIAELPSSPCLSSRVETGIAIDPNILRAIDRVERYLRQVLPELGLAIENVRCRYRIRGIVIELDGEIIAALDNGQRSRFTDEARAAFAMTDKPVLFENYRLGSAFLHPINLVRG